jgi:hypothetical protein
LEARPKQNGCFMLPLGHKGSSSLNKHLVDWETPDILVATWFPEHGN